MVRPQSGSRKAIAECEIFSVLVPWSLALTGSEFFTSGFRRHAGTSFRLWHGFLQYLRSDQIIYLGVCISQAPRNLSNESRDRPSSNMPLLKPRRPHRSEEHTYELQSLMRN